MNVLVIEDDPGTSAMLETILSERAHQVTCASLMKVGWRAFEEGDFQIVILDLNLPDGDGYDFCRQAKSHQKGKSAVILIHTVRSAAEALIPILEAGAEDYICKTNDVRLLLVRIMVAEKQAENLLARIKAESQLYYEASHDALTGLLNRAYLFDRLASALKSAARSGQPLSLSLMDIDHFKRINDTHGHLAGDRVLAAVGEAVKAELRPDDFAARYGGDEFCLVFPGTAAADAANALERIRARVMNYSGSGQCGKTFEVTVTLGVASLSADHSCGTDLIAAADAALYRAKESGRNRIQIA